ncbi:MAG TPA: diguanylate cyclase [Gammaproteobacteria bacterium]
MLPTTRPPAAALHGSPYAAELREGVADRRFRPELEAEYQRARLLARRVLVRATCTLAVLAAAARGTELVLRPAPQAQLAAAAAVLAASLVLLALATTRLFERCYLPAAGAIVPVRNVVVAILVAWSVTHDQSEMLMILPLMILGPFFFLGLTERMALLSTSAMLVAFAGASAAFGVAVPTAVRTLVFLLMVTAVCAAALRYLERWSRKSFLEARLATELAQHDTLTGIKNRAVFDEHLHALWRRAIEEGRTLAVLLIDVDYFKSYNDAYGHQAGDRTLQRVAQTLQSLVAGPAAVLARYGGEEFAVILYGAADDEARAAAERMRAAVRGLAIEHRASSVTSTVTISVGVAVVQPSDERQPRGALQLADQALYEAKVRGRNRVEILDRAAHRLLVTGVFAKTTPAPR